MKYLLDTNIIVDHLRNKRSIEDKVLESEAAISIITLGELLHGVYKTTNPQANLSVLTRDLRLLDLKIENLSQEIMHEFAKIKAELETKGQGLEDFDLLIGATAKTLNLILVTKNLTHFKRIKGLKLANK